MIIDWQPIVVWLLLAASIMYFRGGQNHLAGMLVLVCFLLGGEEKWCIHDTLHTMSQNYTAWYLRDPLWALSGMTCLMQGIITLGYHFFLGRSS